jgi:phenylacetic acid degradation protein
MKLTVYSIDGVTPVVDPTAFVHPSAVLIGDVIVGPGCYIGPMASLRGDFGAIRVRAGANIQDSCIMHGFPGTDTLVEENGHIGHGAVLHSCVIGKDALVGIHAVVNDNAVIGEFAVVAANAFVKAGMVVPPRTLVAGTPAKVVRQLSPEDIEWKRSGTLSYQELTRRCLATMRATAPLRQPEPDRRRFEIGEIIPLHVHKQQRKSTRGSSS